MAGLWLPILIFSFTQPMLNLLIVFYFTLIKKRSPTTISLIFNALAYLWMVIAGSLFYSNLNTFDALRTWSGLLFFIPSVNLANSVIMVSIRTYYSQISNVSLNSIGIYQLLDLYILL